jgi:RNA polymerase primary sigma factor
MWSAPVYAASALLCIISDKVRMRESRADQRSLGGPSSVVAIGPSAVSTVGAVSTSDLPHIDREPTPAELADKLALPLEKVLKVLEIAKRPIRLERPLGDHP